MTATVLGAVGMTLDLILSARIPGIPNGPSIVSIVGSLLLLSFLWVRRASASTRVASAVFIVNAALISYAMFVRDQTFAQLPNWVPFQATKVGCIAAALLGPTLPAAMIGILLHSSSALLVFARLEPTVRDSLALEPLGTVGFALVGAVLAYDRTRRLSLERDVVRARAEAVAAEQLARTVLAIRELANTPIQTIELCNQLLRRSDEAARPRILDRIERSTTRLRELSELLLEYQSSAKWREDDTAMNAANLLVEGADRVRRTTRGRG